MARVEWCRTEHQVSEQCDGVDVNSDLLLSASRFIHLITLHIGRAVVLLVEELHYKPVRFRIMSLEFFFDLILPTL